MRLPGFCNSQLHLLVPSQTLSLNLCSL
jgi:hypothetical protein